MTGSSRKRERLRNRRPSTTFDFEQNGLGFTCTYSEYDDGRLAEIFLQNHKLGSQSDSQAREGAIACSIALQCGVLLEDLQRALPRNADGSPAGQLGRALDLIAEMRRG